MKKTSAYMRLMLRETRPSPDSALQRAAGSLTLPMLQADTAKLKEHVNRLEVMEKNPEVLAAINRKVQDFRRGYRMKNDSDPLPDDAAAKLRDEMITKAIEDLKKPGASTKLVADRILGGGTQVAALREILVERQIEQRINDTLKNPQTLYRLIMKSPNEDMKKEFTELMAKAPGKDKEAHYRFRQDLETFEIRYAKVLYDHASNEAQGRRNEVERQVEAMSDDQVRSASPDRIAARHTFSDHDFTASHIQAAAALDGNVTTALDRQVAEEKKRESTRAHIDGALGEMDLSSLRAMIGSSTQTADEASRNFSNGLGGQGLGQESGTLRI